MANKLTIMDSRMLQVMQYCIDNQVQGITQKKEWCILVGLEPQNLSNVTNGNRSFTVEQIYSCCHQFGIGADYIFGFVDQMNRVGTKATPMQLLKQAVRLVDAEMQGRKKSNKLSNKNR